MATKQIKQLELKYKAAVREHQKYEVKNDETRERFSKILRNLSKKNEQLEGDLKKMVDDKQEIYNALTAGSVVTRAVTLTGSIDNHRVEVKGMINRKGPNSSEPPSPCKNCTRMISLGTTDMMIRYGVFCRYAGGTMKGHI